MLSFHPSSMHDAFEIALHARHMDRVEWTGLGPESITLAGQLVSAIEKAAMVWTAKWKGTPIAVWGCTPDPYVPVGIPWLIGVPEMEKHVRPLIVEGRKYVHEMQQEFPLLINYVHSDNTKARAWLRRLGFTIDSTIFPLGRSGDPYLRFYKECVIP